ncbi:complement resistance protein TraT, partial [Escherichia coli]|uniref:complement resistance protein TraT n=1 Tax=Escherichia coli TaxID=562 RepID=UPI002023B693
PSGKNIIRWLLKKRTNGSVRYCQYTSDINYTMITDVQIAERTRTSVRTDNVAALRQGTSGSKIQTSTETGNQHKYQTRVVSSANQVNLKFEEAKPHLEDQLAKSIANIL